MKYKASEIAGDPNLYNGVWIIGKRHMECYGYSRTGETVLFVDIVPLDFPKVLIIRKYVNPDTELESVDPNLKPLL